MADLTQECAAFIAALKLSNPRAADVIPDQHAPIMAGVLTSMGCKPDAGFLADWYMLCHRGDFAQCRQPADYARAWLRLKLQHVGEG